MVGQTTTATPYRGERCSHGGSGVNQNSKMREPNPGRRRSADGPTPIRSSVSRPSLNSRLGKNGPAGSGVNGPAGSGVQNREEQSSDSDRVSEDITLKVANLSLQSPVVPLKKSFNDRLSKVRSIEDDKPVKDCTESVSETPEQLYREERSVDDIISQFIKEEVCVPAQHVWGSSAVEEMPKRDHSGVLKTEEVVATNGTYEPVVEEPAVVVKETGSDSPPGPREPDRKYIRRSATPIGLCSKLEHPIREESVEGKDASSGSPPHPREPDRKYIRRSDISNGSSSRLESVRREVTAIDAKRGSPWSREQDRKYARRSDSDLTWRKESPQCSSEKISRNDYPLSFGSGKRRSGLDCDIVDEVERYFNKRFYLSSKNDWKMPEASEVFSAQPWEVKELLQCKDQLNAVKEKLNDLDLKEWHAHTKKRNKAGRIVWKVRKQINPEFPTQAWCKFYENVCTFKLVPEKAIQDKKLNTVHLCEAPGAFITSLNHYIKTNFDDDFQWNWLGTTLNPHYEGNPLSLMINEDRFILHTLDHWTFGEDQTGNLMTPPNVADLMDRAGQMGEVLLVTADGSIDCQDDPGEQENYVAWLHYCEAFSAMMVLAEGGNFLLKMFTMFEHMTVSLLYLLSCAFEKVIVNKPATSKEGNSETYVVCKNFAGKEKLELIIPGLTQNYGPNHPRKALFPREAIPEEFVEAVIECANTFRRYQSEIIEANLKYFHDPSERETSRIDKVKWEVANEFFRRYRLKDLPDRYDIVGRVVINQMETYNMDPRLEVGSFSDRLRRAEVSDRQKMLDMKEDIERLDRQVLDQWPADKDIWWHNFECDPAYNLSKDMKIVTGKPVKRINSSKFCLGRLLDIRNKVREIILNSKAINLPSLNSRSNQLVTVPEMTSVMDFKNALWASSDAGLNSEEEYKAFNTIIEEFDKLSRDDNLCIYGYPLLTQFNVGLVYLLAHSFERMALTRPKGQNFAVIFEKHDVSHRKVKVKQELDEISDRIESGSANGSTVLAMLPIEKLCTGDFYKYITMANNICVKEQVLELIEEYLKATEPKEERENRRRTIA